jgi:hypothetical protein
LTSCDVKLAGALLVQWASRTWVSTATAVSPLL